MLGNRLRQIRLELKITQEMLACSLNVSQELISQLECGKRNFNRKILTMLEDHFNVSFVEIEDLEKTKQNKIFITQHIETLLLEDLERVCEYIKKQEAASTTSKSPFRKPLANH